MGEQSMESLKRVREVLIVTLLLALTVLLTARNMGAREFWYSDDAGFALDGAMLHDLVWKPASMNPVESAIRFYVRYPGLTMGYHPVILPLAEAILYSIVGISLFSCHLAVICFGVIAVLYFYWLCKYLYGTEVAIAAAALLATAPYFVFWSREVMSEIPLVAVTVAALYHGVRYIDGDDRAAWPAAMAVGLTPYAKQTGILVVAVLLGYALWTQKIERVMRRRLILPAAVGVVLILAVGVLYFAMGRVNVIQAIARPVPFGPSPPKWSWESITFYLRALVDPMSTVSPGQLTIPLIVLAVLGSAWGTVHSRRQSFKLVTIWLTVCYLFFTFALRLKGTRFTIVWVPAFCLLAALVLMQQPGSVARSVSALAIGILIAYQFFVSWTSPMPAVGGNRQIVEYLAEHPHGDSIMVHYDHQPNLPFLMRSLTPDQYYVLRANKVLYSSVQDTDMDLVEHVEGAFDVLKMLDDWGTGYVLISQYRGQAERRPVRLLRQVLSSPDFQFVRSFSIRGARSGQAETVMLFQRTEPHPRTITRTSLQMPIVGRSLNIWLP